MMSELPDNTNLDLRVNHAGRQVDIGLSGRQVSVQTLKTIGRKLVTKDKWMDVINTALAQAIEGDSKARIWLSDFLEVNKNLEGKLQEAAEVISLLKDTIKQQKKLLSEKEKRIEVLSRQLNKKGITPFVDVEVITDAKEEE